MATATLLTQFSSVGRESNYSVNVNPLLKTRTQVHYQLIRKNKSFLIKRPDQNNNFRVQCFMKSNNLGLQEEEERRGKSLDEIIEEMLKTLSLFIQKTAMAGVVLGLLMTYNPHLSLAASGGRMGGRSFSTSSSSGGSSSSSGRSSSSSGRSSSSSSSGRSSSSSSGRSSSSSGRSSSGSSSKSSGSSSRRSSSPSPSYSSRSSSSSSPSYSSGSSSSSSPSYWSSTSSSSPSPSYWSSTSSSSPSPSYNSSSSKSYSKPKPKSSPSEDEKKKASEIPRSSPSEDEKKKASEIPRSSPSEDEKKTASEASPSEDEQKAAPGAQKSTTLKTLAVIVVICVAIYWIANAYEGRQTKQSRQSSVIMLQVALLGATRSLQKDLDKIAEVADTSTTTGLSYILQESTVALLRHLAYCFSSYSSVDVKPNVTGGENLFNQLTIEERAKFDEETLVNVDNIKKKNTPRKKPNGLNSDYIVMTILVATKGEYKLRLVNNNENLKEALQTLGSIPTNKILAVEVMWTPQEEHDTLSERDLLKDYPRLRPL